jgi:arabinogalactan endo-1,4-beta-galactosidase
MVKPQLHPFYRSNLSIERLLLSLFLLSLFLFSCNGDEPIVDPDDDEDPIEVPDTTTSSKFYFGADLSSVNMVEDYGAVYKENGNKIDPFALFKNHGCTVVRVRLFHNPDAKDGYSQYYKPGYCGLKDVTKTIRRAKAAGMEVSLDFHFSDTWADPGKQEIPSAWKGLSLAVLKDSLYNYTLSVLNSLKSQNLTPQMVQLGNEIDPGILLPTGESNSALAILLNKAIKAVRDFSSNSTIKPKIIIHYGDNQNTVWRHNNLKSIGVTDYDIIGMSYYDKYAKIKFSNLASVIGQLKTQFKKEVMVVETSYQWTNASRNGTVYTKQIELNGYPVSQQGQLDYLKALTQTIIDAGGNGIMYWEPAWIKSSISWGLEIESMFDFDGNVLPSMNYMNYNYKFN